MSRRFNLRLNTRLAALTLGTLALGALPAWNYSALAAPARVEPFTAQTWNQFHSDLQRPAVVIFSTTDCVYCPSVIESVARDIAQKKAPIALIVVVMDGAGKPNLQQDPEYRHASRLFAFSGPSAPLQYAINPKWRGITPYVALFAPHAAPKLVAGRPSTQDLNLLLTPSVPKPAAGAN